MTREFVPFVTKILFNGDNLVVLICYILTFSGFVWVILSLKGVRNGIKPRKLINAVTTITLSFFLY